MDSNSVIMMRKLMDYKVSELRRVFRRFDPDDEGVILLSDVSKLLTSCGLQQSDATLVKIYKNTNLSESKYIYFEEFILILDILTSVGQTQEDEDELRHIFDIFDRDSIGFITAAGVKKTATLLGVDITTTEAEDMMTEYDKDGDGRLTFEEFSDMMQSR